MEEDIKETTVVNKEEIEAEAEAANDAAEDTNAKTVTADPVSDDIEYTLIAHEVPDLTVPVPVLRQVEAGIYPAETEEAEEESPSEETEAAEEKDPSEETGETQEETAAKEEAAAQEEAADGETEAEENAEAGYGLPEGHVEMGELSERIQARRRYHERKKRKFRTRFYVILSVIIIGTFFLLLSLSSIFTVDSIEVKGNKHYTAEEIINMGHATPGRNLFYSLNKQETEEYLLQNPYIESATVSRKLPSTMVIKVKERTEKIAFRYDDDYLIMDAGGILLKKTRNAPKTTLVEGIVVNKIKLGEKIGTEKPKLMDQALDLIKAMTAADLYFVKIDLSSEKQIKAYIYDTLVVKTDYDTLMTNLKNGRLHLVVEKLFSEGIERGTITFEEDGSASFMPVI